MSYPIDIESVKSTKLFKKFMESKNKSISATGPRIENVDINVRSATSNQSSSFNPTVDHNYPAKIVQKQQPVDRPSYIRQQFTTRRNVEPTLEPSTKVPNPITINNFEVEQRKTEIFGKERNTIKDESQEKKYDKLLEEYNELKCKVSAERKQTRKQMIKLEQQADLLSKKVFELRSRQDELILENKRLKEKSVVDQKQRQQIEEVNRQLIFQVQQLKDMLDGQENSSKKKDDETSHWRKMNDDLKQRIRELEMEVTKLRDLSSMMEKEKFVIEREVSNKELHLNEMREKIHSMIAENGTLRDQIFHITGKLYHFEQENKSLRADLKRHSDDFPMSYLQEQLQQARYSRPQTQYNPQETYPNQQGPKVQGTENSEKRTERRRGEFARERGIKKAQNQSEVKAVQQPVGQQTQGQNREVAQAIRKLEQLNEELQKLKDSKAMNGTMRRQKINIQRQILELEEFLKTQQ